MATNTEKLNLKLPSKDDFYNVDDINENFEKIDEFAKGLADSSGAIGSGASTTHGGGAVGENARGQLGGFAGGKNTSANGGGAIGDAARASFGGAVGQNATAGHGFSGGKDAKVDGSVSGGFIDAIQLGTGTNMNEKTLQIYEYQLMDASGKVPSERLPIATGSYTGTGTYGSSNKNSLSFPFTPKIVFISAVTEGDSSFHAPMPIIYGCATARINFRVDASSDRCYSDCIYLEWSGKWLKWYSTNTTYKSRMQLNDSGVTYNWVAIG